MTEMTGILCGTAIFLLALYYHYTVNFNFWKKRNVPGPKAIPFFGTTIKVTLGRISMMQYYKEIYDAYKDVPMVGFFEFSKPFLILKDPELIKDVLMTDSTIFAGRGINFAAKVEPLKKHLINMSGKKAMLFKAQISPIFTPKKIKSMFPLLLQRSEIFKAWLDALVSQNTKIDCAEITSKLIADFSAHSIFGFDVKTIKDEESQVLSHINETIVGKTCWKNKTKLLLNRISKQLYNLMSYYLFDYDETTKFFIRFFMDIVKYREENGVNRHDIVSVLMNLKQDPSKLKCTEISDEFIVAQNYGLFKTSVESSATLISYTLYELCLNQSIQDRLREEIQSVCTRNNGEVTLQDVNAMSYLEAIFKETLRKYPVTDILIRQALSDYTFTKPQVFIPKGQLVVVPVYGFHYDPEIYPNPEVYDPERFLGEAASSKRSMFYSPFGHGSRSCVAKQFGTLQVKIGIISILQNYMVSLLHFKNNYPSYRSSVGIEIPQGMYLKFTKIE